MRRTNPPVSSGWMGIGIGFGPNLGLSFRHVGPPQTIHGMRCTSGSQSCVKERQRRCVVVVCTAAGDWSGMHRFCGCCARNISPRRGRRICMGFLLPNDLLWARGMIGLGRSWLTAHALSASKFPGTTYSFWWSNKASAVPCNWVKTLCDAKLGKFEHKLGIQKEKKWIVKPRDLWPSVLYICLCLTSRKEGACKDSATRQERSSLVHPINAMEVQLTGSSGSSVASGLVIHTRPPGSPYLICFRKTER